MNELTNDLTIQVNGRLGEIRQLKDMPRRLHAISAPTLPSVYDALPRLAPRVTLLTRPACIVALASHRSSDGMGLARGASLTYAT
jgi:hypothetical protein